MKIRFSNVNESFGKSRVMHALLCALVLLLAVPFAAHSQQYAGTITGTVTDPSGAAVAGASVTITSPATGVTATTTSSEQGVYSFAQLTAGTYEIHVKHASFKEFIAKSVEVHVSTVTELNAKLELGAATEMVTVEASDVQVQTSSASVGEVVEGTQVRELPLNGENFMGLVTLSPGVSPAQSFNSRDKGLAGGSDFSVNGNPYTNNLFLVDGVNNNDVGSNRTILIYPSVDAIAEFKMLRNSYGPEYGQASGAIISINTRSGENKFHGGLFYAGRNDKLDANDWFSNNVPAAFRSKAELRRNDYGYHISGPVIKDKLFFWWNEEWNKEIRGQSFSACVPTAAEKSGDFSQGLSCGAGAPNFSALPASYLSGPQKLAAVDPAGQLLANFYPNPTPGFSSNGNNWHASEPNKLNWREENVRGDYDLTKKHRITFRWTKDTWTNPAPNGGAFWGDSFFTSVGSDWSQPSRSVMAKLSSQLTPTLINDIHFGWGYNAIITTLAGDNKGIVSSLETALPNTWPSSLKLPGSLPEVGWGGWGGLTPYGSSQTIWNIAPYGNHEDLYTIQDNLSKVSGNHIYKIGAFYGTNAKIENNNGGTDRPVITPFDGAIAGTGTATGNPLANILIPGTGTKPQQFQVSENSINVTAREIWHDFEWYLADSWKIRRNLTLEYGFRWSFLREPTSDGNNQAGWSLAAWSATQAAAHPSDACNGVIIVPGTHPCQDAVAALGALGVPLTLSNGTPGVNAALVDNNNHNIAPRIGIAWDVKGDGKTAVRLGLGQFYQREAVGLDERLAGTAPFVINATTVRTLAAATPLTSSLSVSPSAAKESRGVTPNSWQWNASIERELARNTALEIGYVGNAGVHLTSQMQDNPIPESAWLQSAFTQGGAPATLRPASNFGAINAFARQGHASYHSLQTLFRSRLSNFSTFQAAYTYSHSIGNVELDNSSGGVNQEAVTAQAPGFSSLDKANTNINRPHIFVANEVFFLPKLLKHGAFVQNSLGGWELNSIATIQSGASLSVFSSGASGSCILDTTGPNAGNCMTSNHLAGGPLFPGNSSSLNALIGTGFTSNNRPLTTGTACNSGSLSGNQLLNPAAFTLVGYHLGTVDPKLASRGSCFGPHARNFDMQLAKNWNFKEHYRVKFSVDFFNMFNHANFNTNGLANGFTPAVACGTVAPCGKALNAAGTAFVTDLTNNVVTSQAGVGNFGQTFGVKPGRELQYTLRFTF
jgi:hypothetical protein